MSFGLKLKIGYFYDQDLNLYGDTGNIEILCKRAALRDIEPQVITIDTSTKMDSSVLKDINVIFMGGGPDSGQKSMYTDLLKNKGPYIKDFIENGGVGLFICGSYQLFGHYYKAADGTVLDGLGIYDLHTEHFGNKKPRCIGNVVCQIAPELTHNHIFNAVNKLGATLVGFENHGGRTYLGKKMLPLAKVVQGYGNNGEDKEEGVLYKNTIGTYLHGPILSRNPHLADYLLCSALKLEELTPLDDQLILSAHTASLRLK